jgi:hypothetical protein
MLRFRFRLYQDLQLIKRINAKLVPRIEELGKVQGVIDDFLFVKKWEAEDNNE